MAGSVQTPLPGTGAASAPAASFLSTIIPNYNNLVGQTSSIIGNLLNGTPSPGTVQNATATFGVNNGLGTGSGVLNNYGYNLYDQTGQANQAAGMQDLSSLIGSVSSPTLTNQGQQLQNSQYNAGLNQQENEFGQNLAEQQFTDQINSLIGLSNSGIGGGNTTTTSTGLPIPSATQTGSTGNPQLDALLSQASASQSANGYVDPAVLQNIELLGGQAAGFTPQTITNAYNPNAQPQYAALPASGSAASQLSSPTLAML